MPNIDFQNGLIAGAVAGGAFQQGGGGTQQQADWNQNDNTQVDYIKNRPFYSETTTITHDYYTITLTGDEDSYVNIDGYAPDLESMVGQNVQVDFLVNDVSLTQDYEVVENQGMYAIIMDYQGVSLGNFISKVQLVDGQPEPSDTGSVFIIGEGLQGVPASVKIYIPYTKTETIYHKLDNNYLDIDNILPETVYDIYAEKTFVPTELINQPSTSADFSDIPEGYFYVCWLTGNFIVTQTLAECMIKANDSNYTPSSSEVLFSLTDYDTGLGYLLQTGMNVQIIKDEATETFKFLSYADETETSFGQDIQIPAKQYDEMQIDCLSNIDMTYTYDAGTDTLGMGAPRSFSFGIANTASNAPSINVFTKHPNGVSIENDFQNIIMPEFYFTPPIDITYNQGTVTYTPLKYYKGEAISDLENGVLQTGVGFNVHSHIIFNETALNMKTELSGTRIQPYWLENSGSPVDLTNTTFDYSELNNSTYKNKIADNCLEQEINTYAELSDSHYTQPINKINEVQIYSGGSYFTLNTKIIIKCKSVKQN